MRKQDRTEVILAGLDPDQRAAVTASPETPLLVAAGPGAGKTRVLTHRIAWLIASERVSAGDVMALTFTNAAAMEMGERLNALIDAASFRVRISTIHAMAARVVRAHAPMVGLTNDFTIFDSDAQLKLAAQVLEGSEDGGGIEPADLVRQVGLAKSQLRDPAQLKVGGQARLAKAYIAFDKELTKANALDFEGLVVQAIRILCDSRVGHGWRRGIGALLVDEFQDVSEAQFELLRLLAGEGGNHLTVIGDEDQSLYSWRGASTALLTGFEKHFPVCQVIDLSRNYRSHSAIVEPASQLICHNNGRRDKDLRAVREGVTRPRHARFISEEAEALGVVTWARELLGQGASASELAVLVRVRNLPLRNELERHLAGAGIAYHAIGSVTLWERSEIRDVLALFHLLANPEHWPAFSRVFEQIPGLGAKATEAILETAKQQQIKPVDVCRQRLVRLGRKRDEAQIEFVERLDTIDGLSETKLGFGRWVGEVINSWGFAEQWQQEENTDTRRESVVQLFRAGEEYQARCELENTQPRLIDWLNELSLHAPRSGKEAEKQGIALATIHASKGLEFDHVWIGGFDEGVLPSYRSLEEGREDEERRLAYVGMTRAKETLTVSSSETRRGKESVVSRFLLEAGIGE